MMVIRKSFADFPQDDKSKAEAITNETGNSFFIKILKFSALTIKTVMCGRNCTITSEFRGAPPIGGASPATIG